MYLKSFVKFCKIISEKIEKEETHVFLHWRHWYQFSINCCGHVLQDIVKNLNL